MLPPLAPGKQDSGKFKSCFTPKWKQYWRTVNGAFSVLSQASKEMRAICSIISMTWLLYSNIIWSYVGKMSPQLQCKNLPWSNMTSPCKALRAFNKWDTWLNEADYKYSWWQWYKKCEGKVVWIDRSTSEPQSHPHPAILNHHTADQKHKPSTKDQCCTKLYFHITQATAGKNNKLSW